jgi:hypothetical protein
MKASKKLAPALVLLGFAVATGLGFLSQSANVKAEASSHPMETTAIKATDDASSRCEQREVEADEGYGVSRTEIRLVCR